MEKTIERSPKYVFLHLFVFALLYVSIVSFITLLFQYISILAPDQLQGYLYGSYDGIRWSSSALLVCYPVFLAVSWLLQRDMRRQPNLRELRTRKWLLSLTLLIAAITIIVDLIQVIYRFYGGEITTQFFLKLLTVLAIAGIVFGYYFWEYRRENQPSGVPHIAAWVSGVALLVSLVAGLFIAGSPAERRMIRFDERRVTDLQQLQNEIASYWQRTESLPASLDDLVNDFSGYSMPTDPEHGTTYEYRVTGDLNFQLCATFNSDSTSRGASGRYPEYYMNGISGTNWDHGTGQVCFERAIDPNVLTPLQKPL